MNIKLDASEMLVLHKKGKTPDEIARLANCWPHTVRNRLFTFGVGRGAKNAIGRAERVAWNAGYKTLAEAKKAILSGKWDPLKEMNCGKRTYVALCEQLGIKLDGKFKRIVPKKHKCSSCGNIEII